MRSISALAGTLVLVASLTGQGHVLAPAGFENVAGNSVAYNQAFAMASPYYSRVTWQVATSDLPNKKLVLTSVAYRTQVTVNYSMWNGMGRTLNVVSLKVGNAVGRLTATFSNNWSGANTWVHASRIVTLPSVLSGRPIPKWGNAGSFPFSNAFMWDPKKGRLLQEWAHQGGVLANGYTGANSRAYYVDGNQTPPRGTGQTPAVGRYLPRDPRSGSASCRDSSTLYSSDAYAYLGGTIYADNYPETSLRGRIGIHARSDHTAPGAVAISAVSIGGSDTGVEAGFGCNRLYVSALPVAMLAKKAPFPGPFVFGINWTDSGGYPSTLPYSDSWAGTPVYFQVVWTDSVTKQPKATIATKLVLPKKQTYVASPELARHVLSYQANGKLFGPFLGSTATAQLNPIDRWGTK